MSAPPPLDGAVGITPYVTPGVYGGRNIVYRIEDHGYGTYAYREWAIPLGEMLATITQERLTRAPLATGPALFDSRAAPTVEYLWRGSVREFEEVDRGPQVFAAVALDAQIVRASDNAILWSGSRRLERQVQESRSMHAIVSTLSGLATEAVDALIAESATALRSQMSPSTPMAPARP